ncbi:uncharacterized protein LOC132159269 [Carassius carassius]|uniref:uncharacterized protein LOC132159269 n=1 Tax=Carassius carassius TaxID=217509 RepID=UPI0028691B8E|nr:uncharacterized protein LOC132159269 [Carassius carassius]
MALDVERKVKPCGRCIRRKALPERAAPLVDINTTKPLELLCMDFLSLEPDKSGTKDILVITDHFTKFAVAMPTPNQKAHTVAKCLWENFMVHYGTPEKLHSDEGPDFESYTIKEKPHTTLGATTRNEVTGFTSYELMFRRQPRLPVDLAFGLPVQGVSLQVTGDLGGSVLLACSSAEPDQDTEVHWRQNGNKNVFDIIKGTESVEQQDPRYKNRVESFPEEYVRGNFSIKLNKLQVIDAGRYTCFISHSSEHKTVELIIKESTAENGTKSAATDNVTKLPTEEPKTDVVTPLTLIWVSIIVVLLVMLIAGCIAIIIGYRKKIQSALFSPVMTEDKEPRQI